MLNDENAQEDVDHPAATFIVLAFNQAGLIEEAIDAAFTQDYPNLQVLLSDDGSADGTFEIMQRRVAEYRGPHRVRAIRTPQNAGLVHHVQYAASQADGDLIVCAAGDDISLPHRVRTLVDHWRHDRPAVIYSAWNRVDYEGRFCSRGSIADQYDPELASFFPDESGVAAFGCTTAYSTDFLRSVADPGRPIWIEDYFLSVVAMLTGERIIYVDEALVSYRQNPAAQRNFTVTPGEYRAFEEREARFHNGFADLLTSLLDMVDRNSPPARTRVNRDMIVKTLLWYRYRSDWAQRSWLERLRYTSSLRSKRYLRWALPRVPGLNIFLRGKTAMAGFRRSR